VLGPISNATIYLSLQQDFPGSQQGAEVTQMTKIIPLLSLIWSMVSFKYVAVSKSLPFCFTALWPGLLFFARHLPLCPACWDS